MKTHNLKWHLLLLINTKNLFIILICFFSINLNAQVISPQNDTLTLKVIRLKNVDYFSKLDVKTYTGRVKRGTLVLAKTVNDDFSLIYNLDLSRIGYVFESNLRLPKDNEINTFLRSKKMLTSEVEVKIPKTKVTEEDNNIFKNNEVATPQTYYSVNSEKIIDGNNYLIYKNPYSLSKEELEKQKFELLSAYLENSKELKKVEKNNQENNELYILSFFAQLFLGIVTVLITLS